MSLGKRKLSARSLVARLAAVGLLVAGTVVAVSAPAGAAAPDSVMSPGVRPPGSRSMPPPQGVTPKPAGSRADPIPRAERPKLKLRSRDKQTAFVENGYTCQPWAYFIGAWVGYDGYLEEVADVGYMGGIECDVALNYISGGVGLVDRSPVFNEEWFDGRWLASSNMLETYSYGASTSGGAYVYARNYNGGRIVEPVIELYLVAPGGAYWESCDYVPGLYYYDCYGLGTDTLYLRMGAYYWDSGLTRACRVQSLQGDNEQRRVTTLSGSTPASTQILNLIPAIRSKVIAFKREMCFKTASEAATFANDQGELLWLTAVEEAKKTGPEFNDRLYDDRPLYWARLSMTLALAQWLPSFVPNRAALQRSLDRASRGMNSHAFTRGTSKRVFVSGFDPFDLDGGGIMRGNPSAAAVLGLDDSLRDGAEVQVVIFPVRYDDFDAFIVEDTVNQHLAAGPQQATLITTVSQGRAGIFDLEYWNGRNRTQDDFADNLGVITDGSPDNPETPPYQAVGKEFSQSTLPLTSMVVGSHSAVCTHVVLKELETRGGTPLTRPSDSNLQCSLSSVPTPSTGWLAVAGSGGGFLSNEVAYRVTELRDRLNVTVPSGHIHTPEMDTTPTPAERAPIVDQYRQILSAAIAATPGSGGGGGGGGGETMYCGEASCTPVQGGYISHFTGSNCTGTESYYTPYFNSDGIRRSWDGRGLAGTTLRTVTNRSWMGTDGQCHDDWSGGNTLSGFVTIYRCGEPTCTPVQAAYISHFTGLGCTGTESYYTPYFNSDGVRRSWDGRGVAGTTMRTVTNRSWKGADGQCHDEWSNGNTLSGFVTVYR